MIYKSPDTSYQVLIGLIVQEKKQKRISDPNNCSFFFIYKSSRCFLLSFKSIGLSVQKKKQKINFQDGDNLGFPIGTILAFSIYKSPRCFQPSFQSTGLSVQQKNRKIYFQDGGHLGFPIGTIFRYFMQVLYKSFTSHPTLPTKFQLAFQFRRRS